ncbi:MAG: FAD/NAD(P)-binding protein [Candidatus Competibacteraceae bacterium]|nr:FAD/NAD(P)-binding protein [Candidatus Competibacteraceae bacterium]
MNALLQPEPMLPLPYRIEARRQETRDVYTLDLLPNDGNLLSFEPGQFTMLYTFGVGEVPISVSGDPGNPVLVHTIREVGAVTRRLGELGVGESVGVRGPYGRPWPLEVARGRDLVVVAGGVGLAPVRPILYHVLAHRQDFARVSLLVGARTPGDLLFRSELERWRQAGEIEVLMTVDRADGAWTGSVGVVPELVARASLEPAGAVAMICGPEVMMRFSVQALLRAGLAGERIFISLERNMKCGIGTCGHCQLGPHFICKDGPVFSYPQMEPFMGLREL